MRFVQTITVRTTDEKALAELMTDWHEAEAGRAPGYHGSRLLADRDNPGTYMVVVDFSSADEAQRNNDRPETQQWGEQLAALIESDPVFANFDEIQDLN